MTLDQLRLAAIGYDKTLYLILWPHMQGVLLEQRLFKQAHGG